jgi:predicted DNA-binding transcriptional regulator
LDRNDELRVVGVDAKGYGRIYKAAMRSPELHILAKCVYAYISAYAGNGTTAFPRRDKITRDLQINKDTLGKYMKQLIEHGFLSKQRTLTGNLYTISTQVPTIADNAAEAPPDASALLFSSIKSFGFGTVPKLVMLDQCLSAQAKAIYAYFCSFAGAGSVAFPHKKTITRELGISERTYYAHFSQLTDLGYLTVNQRKAGGRFDVSEYRVNDEVEIPGQEAMSENLQCGGKPEQKQAMSENLQSGKLTSGILPSEEVTSEKMGRENFGQANIKNNTTNNISKNITYRKEQVYNHQGAAPDDYKPVPLFSLEQAKEIMRYDYWRSEAFAWGDLKDTLGHFATPADKSRYIRRVSEIMAELAKQARYLDNPECVAAAFESEAFAAFFENVLIHWDEIRSVKGYVRASLKIMFAANAQQK